jgi:hypothetical protein
MKCEEAWTLLALRAGGDLPERDLERLGAHLESCAGCRPLGEELAASFAWTKAFGAPPVSEADYAAMRREVWRRIEAGGAKPAAPFAGRRLVLTAAGLFAAALAAVLLVRRAPRESTQVAAVLPPAAVAAGRPSPAPAREEASVSAAPAPLVTAPARVTASNSRSRVRPRPPAVSGESAVERIEFRTANPNVRIIWLVKKGEEKSSSIEAGRIEEVS